METHVTGQPVLGELRQHVLAVLISNRLFSEAEHVQATHFVHECEDIAGLTHWQASVQVEMTRREAETACQRRYHATYYMLCHLHTTSFRGHCSRSPRLFLTWVAGVFMPDRADCQAGNFDRLVTAHLQPADVRNTYLLSRQSG